LRFFPENAGVPRWANAAKPACWNATRAELVLWRQSGNRIEHGRIALELTRAAAG
jgi:hypothetical protein